MSALTTRLGEMHGKRGWIALAATFAVVGVVLPLVHMPDYLVALLGKFFCYAIVAIAMDLIWGFTGILSLGHGVFFAIGGYAIGMYLMLSIG